MKSCPTGYANILKQKNEDSLITVLERDLETDLHIYSKLDLWQGNISEEQIV